MMGQTTAYTFKLRQRKIRQSLDFLEVRDELINTADFWPVALVAGHLDDLTTCQTMQLPESVGEDAIRCADHWQKQQKTLL